VRVAELLPTRLAALGLVALVIGLAACQAPDSILLVEVSGDLTLMPAEMDVTITAGGQTRGPILVPPSPTPFTLPTSFTVELDRSITGPVTIEIVVFDGNGYVVAHGTATQTYIDTGGQTIVSVTLITGAP
jgi:hypothetical protein